MSAEIPASLDPHTPPPVTGWRAGLRTGENGVVALCLVLLVTLPVLEIILRQFRTGVEGSSEFVQHCTLLIGMLGGALAARDQRLLALSAVSQFFTGWLKVSARVLANGVAAAVTTFLCVSAMQFVLSEKNAGAHLAYNIPKWWVQMVLPGGFALIALRLVWNAGLRWWERAATLAVAAAAVGIAVWGGIPPEKFAWPMLLALGVATVLGAPIFVTIGGAAMILLHAGEFPIAAVPLKHYSLVTDASLPTIPLFTLAGYFLAEGGASRRLVRVFQALVGQFRGGPAIATALACAFFTSFTGASGVTILALGGLLMPVLLAARYSERNALGLLTGAGALGLLLPPCLPLILYSIVASRIAVNLGSPADISIEKMFLAGILPGVLMIVLVALWGIWRQPAFVGERPRFNAREAGAAVWDAKWELALPVVALVALFSGWATPVEAAAVTALYACFIEVVIYRDLKVRQLPKVMAECGLLVGGVLLILGVAMGLTNYLVTEQIPDALVEWVSATVQSPLMFLLLLNLFLLIVGCLMDIYSAIVVVVPLIVPIALKFGIDPVHLGIIFLANLELGYLTPPVGMNLFLSSYRFNKPMSEVTRATLPMLGVMAVGVALITYFPWLTMWLPGLFKGG
ncbi:MAG: TRAP transporter large permease subunit [Limisphaerales bacterium]